MRIEVHRDGDLVAVFEYGHPPVHYGARGRQGRRLVERPHPVRHLWTGETAAFPPDDGPLWWAWRIFNTGLREAGFAIRVALAFDVAGDTGGRLT